MFPGETDSYALFSQRRPLESALLIGPSVMITGDNDPRSTYCASFWYYLSDGVASDGRGTGKIRVTADQIVADALAWSHLLIARNIMVTWQLLMSRDNETDDTASDWQILWSLTNHQRRLWRPAQARIHFLISL